MNEPLRPLAGIIRALTWLLGLPALAILIANIAGLGWLPGTNPSPVCVDTVCVEHPGLSQQIAYLGHQLPDLLFAWGALVLLLRFLRTAAQEGPYADEVPGRLSVLGWFVLAGGAVSTLLFVLSQHFLRISLLGGVSSMDWLGRWGTIFPWWSIAAGIAALTFAYILRIGVRMREDLEGTI